VNDDSVSAPVRLARFVRNNSVEILASYPIRHSARPVCTDLDRCPDVVMNVEARGMRL
jgi:hypothetical protein